MADESDRAAILERRKRLLASALSGVAMSAFGVGAQACACLGAPDYEDSGTEMRDALPQPCLSSDAGVPPQDAGPNAGPMDAGPDDAGEADGAADAASDDGGAPDSAP